jgi:hypothetical protein
MKKQITASLAATAALMAIAGIAQAAPAELNIYGASAQYLYWNAQAQNYATSKLGCSATAPSNSPDGKHGFVAATNCTSLLVPVNSATTKRDLNIRYSGIASAEGPLSVKKLGPIDVKLLQLITSYDASSKPVYAGTTGACNVAAGERAMYGTSATTADCHVVHVGTSDVAGETLTQTSTGQKLGPNGGGAFGTVMTGVNTTGLTPANTVVVPFGFFVNSAVTAKQCTSGLIGNYCTTDAHCNTAPSATNGTCGAAATITNITREEASLIFAGSVTNWSDLGAYFTAQPAVVCFRHAGSGTHSALDATIMNSGWGGVTLTDEAAGQFWFNQGASDEIKCINGNSTALPDGPTYPADAAVAAIGYADADQAVGVAKTSQNVKQLKFNGQYPTRTAIRNGQYDFYTNAWLYTNPANGTNYPGMSTSVNSIAADMVTYAQDPANVPASKANYWAAVSEMKYNRAADNTYPAFTGATSPVLP